MIYMSIDMIKAKVELITIIDKLRAVANFDEFLSGNCSFSEWYCGNSKAYINNITDYASGETRGVIITDFGYVFKVDNHISDIDYCASEAYVYSKALDEEIDQYFAEVYPIYTITVNDINTTFYVTHFYDIDYDKMESNSYNFHLARYCADNDIDFNSLSPCDQDDIRDSIDVLDASGNDGMLEYVASLIPFEDYTKLLDFISKMHINDLHAGNWGWDGENIICIDYAGYNVNIKEIA